MPIVAYHNSWPYFARRFRLDFVGFIETKPGVPPSPSHLAGIVQTMRARGVRIVVREPHEPERDVAFVANKAGASVVTLAASVGALPRDGRLHLAVRRQRRGPYSSGGQTMIEPLIFLWPAFLVAVALVGIHAYFGIQVLARKVIFVDLALAQIAALGATVAFMLGHPAQSVATYGYSLAFTLLAAVLLAFTRAWGSRVPQEALIGVIYVVAAAAADPAHRPGAARRRTSQANPDREYSHQRPQRGRRHRAALCRGRTAALAVAPPADAERDRWFGSSSSMRVSAWS